MKLYDSLKKFREDKGVKQNVIAKALGISPPTYNRYEKGEREPDIKMIIKIARFYRVPVQSFFLDYSKEYQFQDLYLGELGTLFHVKFNHIVKIQLMIIQSKNLDIILGDNKIDELIKEYKQIESELKDIATSIGEGIEQSFATIEQNKGRAL